jgi:GxxExxY protein
MTENEISGHVVDAAYHAHCRLGPGLLESVYQAVLASELRKRGLKVSQQQVIPIVYEGIRIKLGFRADLVIEDRVIVEIKSIDAISPVHKKQLLTYLRLSGKQVGLLINFDVALIKDGIVRIVNGLKE